MCANAKVKYVGSNAAFTADKIYPVLSISLNGSTPVFVILADDASFMAGFPPSDPDIELVSVTYPGDIQLYP